MSNTIIGLPAELPVGSIVARKGYDLEVASNDLTKPVPVWVRKPTHPDSTSANYSWEEVGNAYATTTWRLLLEGGELEVLYAPDTVSLTTTNRIAELAQFAEGFIRDLLGGPQVGAKSATAESLGVPEGTMAVLDAKGHRWEIGHDGTRWHSEDGVDCFSSRELAELGPVTVVVEELEPVDYTPMDPSESVEDELAKFVDELPYVIDTPNELADDSNVEEG